MQHNQFILQPSRYFMWLLLLIHIGAMLLILSLPLKWWANLLIALILLVSLIYHIEKHVYHRLAKAIKSLTYVNKEGWRLTQRNGVQLSATLLGDSVITRHLLILNFKIQLQNKTVGKRSIVIFNDSMDEIGFRQLRLLCLARRR